MSYAQARDVIVETYEVLEDESFFGLLLDQAGQSVSEILQTASPRFWMRRLSEPGARILFWKNVRRVVAALGILHAQGLVHGSVGPTVIMTKGFEEPDFRLTGFEWSLFLASDSDDARPREASGKNAAIYSFEGDWRALGHFIAFCLGAIVTQAGDIRDSGDRSSTDYLGYRERQLVRTLVAPGTMDSLDSASLSEAVDEVMAGIAKGVSQGNDPILVLTFGGWDALGSTLYEVTDGGIPVDNIQEQIQWIQGDLAAGATLIVPRGFEYDTSALRLVTATMVYELNAFRVPKTAEISWEVAVCKACWPRASTTSLGAGEEHKLGIAVKVVQRYRDAQGLREQRAQDIVDWTVFAPAPRATSSAASEVRSALLLVQVLEALIRALDNYPVEVLLKGPNRVALRAEDQSERDEFATRIGLGTTADALHRLFGEDQRDAGVAWRLSRSPSLGAFTERDIVARFAEVSETNGATMYEFDVDRRPEGSAQYFLRPEQELGTEQVIRRRLRNLAALENQVDLARSLEAPLRERRRSPELVVIDDSDLQDLDIPKQAALRAAFNTLPSFFVVGPPGVGKTKLATEVIRRGLSLEPTLRMLVSAQGHDALDHLQKEIREALRAAGQDQLLLVRSRSGEGRPPSENDVSTVAKRILSALSTSDLWRSAPVDLRERIQTLQREQDGDDTRNQLAREIAAEQHAFHSLVLDSANLLLSTANSRDVEQLVEGREQFDWVVIEEAARAMGPELVGPMLLSGRRLLIGDHHQLAPMEADRILRILQDETVVRPAIELARELVAPIFSNLPEFEQLEEKVSDDQALEATVARARKLTELFGSVVLEDETSRKPSSVSATLTEQRRMDPAIATIVSKTFYDGRLTTEAGCASRATDPLPYTTLEGFPQSPIVVIDFPHVSVTGRARPAENGRPRWSNPAEVESIIDVLCRVRPPSAGSAASLAVLSPYAAQVERIRRRISGLSRGPLKHLSGFASVRTAGDYVGTVDSFQGSEADLVVLSLVRNNPQVGRRALGFLRDKRRLNVALSRAKRQLVIVGSLHFLAEAVHGNHEPGGSGDLAFIETLVATIRELASQKRSDGLALASILGPDHFGRRN
jgi:hypothetical protein